MHQRFVSSVGKSLRRPFSNPAFSYYNNTGSHQPTRCTLVPGAHSGPALTESAVQCVKATGAPIIFDMIENFDFTKEECKDALLRNKYILAGNLGTAGSKYIENVDAFHALDLQMNSKLS